MPRKKPSSRENGRRSKGPITQEGKNISRFNATAHGLAAKELVVIPGEPQHAFDEHLQCYRLRFRPLDSPEEDLVHNLAANRWRFVRLLTLETSFMDSLPHTGQREATLQAAFSDPAKAIALERYQRYETRLELNYQRTLRSLAFLRKEFPIPEPLEIQNTQPKDVEPPVLPKPPAMAETATMTPAVTEPSTAAEISTTSGTVEPQPVKPPKAA